MINMYRITNGLVATATGASGAAVLAAVSQEGVTSWTMAALSVSASAVAWYIARRGEIQHMKLMEQTAAREAAREESRLDAELNREERMKRREERMEDLIQQITIARVSQGESVAAAEASARAVLAEAARAAAALKDQAGGASTAGVAGSI